MFPSVRRLRSSWELPELREGRVKAISDSDGVSYPWYGNTTETVTLTGPTSKPSRLTVSMNDNFYPSVTWAVPISNSNTPMLTHITRDQSFITWLVAMNSVTKVGPKHRESGLTGLRCLLQIFSFDLPQFL